MVCWQEVIYRKIKEKYTTNFKGRLTRLGKRTNDEVFDNPGLSSQSKEKEQKCEETLNETNNFLTSYEVFLQKRAASDNELISFTCLIATCLGKDFPLQKTTSQP